MSLQVKGKLKVKGSEQAISDRFRKREFVLTDDSSQYPQHISFQLTQDKCALLDAFFMLINKHDSFRGPRIIDL